MPKVKEPWWGANLDDRVVAGFHYGRLFSQLRWHFIHTWLLRDREHFQYVGHVLEELTAKVDHLAAQGSNRIAELLREHGNEWRDAVEGEQWHEAFDLENEACFHDGLEDRIEHCRALVTGHVEPMLDCMRATITRRRSPRAVTAFQFGDWIDQAIRPTNVYQGMVDTQRPPWRELPDHYDQRNYLANRTVLPGEITADSAWRRRAVELAGQLQIADGLSEPLRGVVNADTCDDRVQAVAALDHAIRQAVVGDEGVTIGEDRPWYHGENEGVPDGFPYGPLAGMKKDLASWTSPTSPDPRNLESRCRAGRFWTKQISRYEYEVWFKSDGAYKAARQQQVDQSRRAP